MEKVRKFSDMYPVFKKIEKASKGQVSSEQAFIAVTALFVVLLFIRPIASPFTNLGALVFIIVPATSLIASKTAPDSGTIKHIVSYLLTYVLFATVDSFVPFLHRRLPFYYQIKFVFFYYLSVRRMHLTEYMNSKVYAVVYDFIVHVNTVDKEEKIKSAQTAANEVINETAEAIKKEKEKEKEKESLRPRKEE